MRAERTLLLTQGYEPLRWVSLHRAIRLLTLGKVEVVESYDDDLHSGSFAFVIKMPAVIRLLHKIPWRLPAVKFSRAHVYARDGYQCQYCGIHGSAAELNLDHIVPRSQGGRTSWLNVVTSCVECNTLKANRTPAEADMKLRAKPYEPKFVPRFRVGIDGLSLPEVVRNYLYWEGELVT